MSSATAFFEAKYRQAADPWNFASSRYELDRYARIMESLAPQHFRRAFEPGCSIGVLTKKLAGICVYVDALDVSVTAVSHAQERCRHSRNVDIRVGSVRKDVPARFYDLIVLGEIGYYFEREDLLEVGAELSARLVPGGVLLAAHWLGHSDDHLLSGDEVHETLASLAGLEATFSERHAGYRLQHWTRP